MLFIELLKRFLLQFRKRASTHAEVLAIVQEDFLVQPQYREDVCVGYCFGPVKGNRNRAAQLQLNRVIKMAREITGWKVLRISHWWWCIQRDMNYPLNEQPPKRPEKRPYYKRPWHLICGCGAWLRASKAGNLYCSNICWKKDSRGNWLPKEQQGT